MTRRIGDAAQLNVYLHAVIVHRLPKGLSDPFRDGHSLTAGNALNLSVLFLIEEDLQSFWHTDSVINCRIAQIVKREQSVGS